MICLSEIEPHTQYLCKMERVPVMLIDVSARDKQMYFMTKMPGVEKKMLSVEVNGRSHTFELTMGAILYVILFYRGAEVAEVMEVHDPKEAAEIAKVKFNSDVLSHALYRSATSRGHHHGPSRLRA